MWYTIYKERITMTIFQFTQQELTTQENKIIDYITHNSLKVQTLTIHSLAQEIGTSTASISRLSKKLGFDSFSQLKLSLAKADMNLDHQIYETDTLQNISHKLAQAGQNAINQTVNLLNYTVLEQTIKLLKKARRIYLVGVGASGIVCSDLYFKLSRIGKDVIYNQDAHVQLASVTSIQQQDVLIGISYSGHTKEVVTAMQYAKQKQVPTIAISSVGKNKLQTITDLSFKLPKQEQEFRVGAITSRDTSLFITDLLYLSLIQGDSEALVDILEQSRQLTHQLH